MVTEQSGIQLPASEYKHNTKIGKEKGYKKVAQFGGSDYFPALSQSLLQNKERSPPPLVPESVCMHPTPILSVLGPEAVTRVGL